MAHSTAPTPAGQRERRVVRSRTGLAPRVLHIWRYRELLVGLVRKELKVKYKNSFLGFLWSMLNPALTLVVFYVVFQLVLGSGIPYFAIYLLSGVLVWNLFAAALNGGVVSMVNNASLIKKVAFPREILPLASIGAALVHFFLQGIVLVAALVIFRYPSSGRYLLLIPPALVVLLIFLSGMTVLLSAVNVYMRDTQHFVELAMLAWFWGTPIVYPFRLLSDKLESRAWMIFLNPVAAVTVSFQRAIYNKVEPLGSDGKPLHILPDVGMSWYLTRLAVVGGASVVLLTVALAVFARLEGNFAEEL
jgi:ABC-2 type transport system permease protein